MKFLPPHGLSALRREMTPSWVGWILIAVLVALFIAWVRGVGADLFYPLQYAVAYGVSGQVQIELFLWLTMMAMFGGYISFGPIMTFVACGPAVWSRHARPWPAFLLLAWGFALLPLCTAFGRWYWRAFGEPAPTYVMFDFIGWIGFILISWFMTRSRWVIAGMVALWILQLEALWVGPTTLRSITWHSALFAVFLVWGVNRRMTAVPSLVGEVAPRAESEIVKPDRKPRTAIA